MANYRTALHGALGGIVSVPLRGKYRGESGFEREFKGGQFIVSVPLRGKYRGESTLSTNIENWVQKVSVPLRGKYRGE